MENMEQNKIFENTLYINLDFRKDRNDCVLKELKKIGIDNPIRISAIDMTKQRAGADVAMGCTLSHIKCLEYAKENQLSQVFICEDDIYITDVELFKKTLKNLLEDPTTPDWDILLLGSNLMKGNPPNIKREKYVHVKFSYSAVAYIIKQRYYDTFINCAREGLKKKIQIDVSWNQLQKKDIFIMPIPATVTQFPSYSDIEKKHANYVPHLLNIDKGI